MAIAIRNCLFKFKCTQKWHELKRTEEEGKRFCSECERVVFFCNTVNDLAFEISLNNCVAIDRSGSLHNRIPVDVHSIPGYDAPEPTDPWKTPAGAALFIKMLHGMPLEEEDRQTLAHIKGLNRALQEKK